MDTCHHKQSVLNISCCCYHLDLDAAVGEGTEYRHWMKNDGQE